MPTHVTSLIKFTGESITIFIIIHKIGQFYPRNPLREDGCGAVIPKESPKTLYGINLNKVFSEFFFFKK